MTADPATLRNYGYPPRPRDPAALGRWRELLARPLRSIRTTITKRTHRDRRVRFTEGTETGPNWSGAVGFSNGSDTPFMVSRPWRSSGLKGFTRRRRGGRSA